MKHKMETEMQNFIEHCKYEKNLSVKTIKAYSTDLHQFVCFLNNHTKNCLYISDITKEIIREHVSTLLAQYKMKTVKRKVACLKTFFNHLEFEEKIPVNPFRKMRLKLKEPFNLPCVMSLQEVGSIIQTINTEMRNHGNNRSYALKCMIRDLAVIELLFATGLRVSELCTLKKNDIDLTEGTVKVRGKGNKERVLYIGEKKVIGALKKYWTIFSKEHIESDFFFVNRVKKRLSEQSVRFMVKKYTKKLNMKKNITPHVFRHTFATLLLEEGVDIKYIQHFLGHSSIMTTQIYTHVNMARQKDILKLYHPRKKLKL